MPRVGDDTARAARDAQLLRLYLEGHSYRAIAAQPGLGLSLRGVVKAVQRQLDGVGAEQLEASFAAAYARACAGDEQAGAAVRRLGEALAAREPRPPVDAPPPARRQAVVSVPLGTRPGVALALAQEQAAALAGGAAVDVQLDGSREYLDYVEWSFSFEVPL